MSNVMTESLNKGVPVGASIDIRTADLLNIVEDKDTVSKVIQKHFKQYMDFIHAMGDTADIEYFYTLSTRIDPNTLERKIIFSPNGFFSTILCNLNIDDTFKNSATREQLAYIGTYREYMNSIDADLRKSLASLRSVKAPEELKRKFPFLFNKYQYIMKKNQQAREIYLKLNSMSRSNKREYIKQFEAIQRKTIPGFSLQSYLNESLSFNIFKFVEDSANTLQLLVDNYSVLLKYIMNSPIAFDGINKSDKDRLELYFAYRFLVCAEMSKGDSQQDYLYYVSNYFADNKHLLDTDLSIVVNSTKAVKSQYLKQINPSGDVITPEMVYERYRKLLVDNPNLRAIDFSHLDFRGMTVNQVESFMAEYLKDLSAQWDFLLPEDRSYEEEIVKKIRTTGKGMTEEERVRHQERLLELLLEKKKLYDSSDPFFRVKGKGTFDGYIGFIYPNGRVVLDKFYDDADAAKVADGHAVYAMGIQEFYELSRLSKTEIIRKNLCKRYIHKGNWVERVLVNEIQAQGSINPSVEVKKLVASGEVVAPNDSLPSSFKK